MSDPVQRKGPGGVTGATPEAAPGTGAAFRSAVDAAATSAVGPGGRAEALRAVATELKAGTLDAAGALERLVQRALSEGALAGLPAEHRARLEATLRAQLANDPTLLGLTRDLEKP